MNNRLFFFCFFLTTVFSCDVAASLRNEASRNEVVDYYCAPDLGGSLPAWLQSCLSVEIGVGLPLRYVRHIDLRAFQETGKEREILPFEQSTRDLPDLDSIVFSDGSFCLGNIYSALDSYSSCNLCVHNPSADPPFPCLAKTVSHRRLGRPPQGGCNPSGTDRESRVWTFFGRSSEQLLSLVAIYHKWNKDTGPVCVKDFPNLYHHFCELDAKDQYLMADGGYVELPFRMRMRRAWAENPWVRSLGREYRFFLLHLRYSPIGKRIHEILNSDERSSDE